MWAFLFSVYIPLAPVMAREPVPPIRSSPKYGNNEIQNVNSKSTDDQQRHTQADFGEIGGTRVTNPFNAKQYSLTVNSLQNTAGTFWRAAFHNMRIFSTLQFTSCGIGHFNMQSGPTADRDHATPICGACHFNIQPD